MQKTLVVVAMAAISAVAAQYMGVDVVSMLNTVIALLQGMLGGITG